MRCDAIRCFALRCVARRCEQFFLSYDANNNTGTVLYCTATCVSQDDRYNWRQLQFGSLQFCDGWWEEEEEGRWFVRRPGSVVYYCKSSNNNNIAICDAVRYSTYRTRLDWTGQGQDATGQDKPEQKGCAFFPHYP